MFGRKSLSVVKTNDLCVVVEENWDVTLPETTDTRVTLALCEVMSDDLCQMKRSKGQRGQTERLQLSDQHIQIKQSTLLKHNKCISVLIMWRWTKQHLRKTLVSTQLSTTEEEQMNYRHAAYLFRWVYRRSVLPPLVEMDWPARRCWWCWWCTGRCRHRKPVVSRLDTQTEPTPRGWWEDTSLELYLDTSPRQETAGRIMNHISRDKWDTAIQTSFTLKFCCCLSPASPSHPVALYLFWRTSQADRKLNDSSTCPLLSIPVPSLWIPAFNKHRSLQDFWERDAWDVWSAGTFQMWSVKVQAMSRWCWCLGEDLSSVRARSMCALIRASTRLISLTSDKRTADSTALTLRPSGHVTASPAFTGSANRQNTTWLKTHCKLLVCLSDMSTLTRRLLWVCEHQDVYGPVDLKTSVSHRTLCEIQPLAKLQEKLHLLPLTATVLRHTHLF